jgi:hypothetical protein
MGDPQAQENQAHTLSGHTDLFDWCSEAMRRLVV